MATTKLVPSTTEQSLSTPKECDLCCAAITTKFVDGKTVIGSWASMCITCHDRRGVGLGTGLGQRYEKQPDGRWAKMVPSTEAKPSKKPPSVATMTKWSNDGIAKATDGCKVEPDGTCPHGNPSWLLKLGYV